MEETEFWEALAWRIGSELSQFESKHLRSFWCDGLVPERVEHRDGGVYMVGRAWIGRGPRFQEKWEFTLLLGGAGATRERANWTALLPTEEETEWLGIREWGLEIVPPAAERALLAGNEPG
ncbi:MAG: hypothetical protein AAF845_15975 [Bacteroidota bacterium]